MKTKTYFPLSKGACKKYWDATALDELKQLAELVPAANEVAPWENVPQDTEIIITGWGVSGKMPEHIWRDLHHLKAICIFGGSAQAIESPLEALKHGITLCNTAHEIASGVAESTLALVLADQYNIVTQACYYRANNKMRARESYPINRGLFRKTVGLVGFGHVAKQFAHLLTPFEVNLLVHDPYTAAEELTRFGAQRVELETLMEESDVISLHAGWNEETEGMLNAALLDKIRPDALLVCTARLPIFDQQALARKIRNGLHFVSDLVPFDKEIWEDPELTKCENFIGVNSHTTITDISLMKMSRRIVEDLKAILSSQEPKNKITAEWILHTT